MLILWDLFSVCSCFRQIKLESRIFLWIDHFDVNSASVCKISGEKRLKNELKRMQKKIQNYYWKPKSKSFKTHVFLRLAIVNKIFILPHLIHDSISPRATGAFLLQKWRLYGDYKPNIKSHRIPKNSLKTDENLDPGSVEHGMAGGFKIPLNTKFA